MYFQYNLIYFYINGYELIGHILNKINISNNLFDFWIENNLLTNNYTTIRVGTLKR